MELLTPREMSQTTETRLPVTTGRVTIPDPNETLGDPVVEQMVRKLIETAGRLVADRNAPASGVTAPYGTIDDTGRVQLSPDVMTREGVSNATLPTRVPDRKIREMTAKKVSRVIDVQKNNQLKYSFTGVPDTDPRACSNRATWNPAVNLQQPPLGTSHLILGDSLVRVLQYLRTSWITTVMAFGGATIAQLFRMVELMNPGRTPNVMILLGTNNILRCSDEEEVLWESMMVCLFTTLWQQFNCAILTVCSVPMSTKMLTATGRRHNEGATRWNNILRNLASRNAGQMIVMDTEHELRAMDQARLTTDGIHFDNIEGQAWLNRVFKERLDELEVELFDTGVLKEEGALNEPVITTFVPPSLETRLGTVPAVTNYRQQSSSEPGQRTGVQDRLGEAPMRRAIHPRRRIGPVNPREETASTRWDTRSETTRTSREERRPNRSSLMWSRPIPYPWRIYKDDLMKLNLQTVSFAADAMRMLNGARLSVSGFYSITGVDWLIAAGINFSSTTAPYGTIDDTGRVRLSQNVMTRQGVSDTTPPMGSSKVPERKIRKMPAKKLSRVIDVQKNNQLKYNFTGVAEAADPRACFNRATWNPAVNLQQPPLGTSHLILGDSLVRVLSNLRTSWVTTVMAFGGATIAQLFRIVELMNPGRIPNVMILVGTNNISRSSDEEEALWESMMVCLFTTLWQKFNCAVLTVCTVPMNARSLTATGRRHNEGVVR